MIHYPVPPHKQKALQIQSFIFSDYRKIHHEVLSLPMSPVLSIDEVDFIIKVLISIKNLKRELFL
jgi:dTDP-4-amino-4,6-dideoxygalactose transaminase